MIETEEQQSSKPSPEERSSAWLVALVVVILVAVVGTVGIGYYAWFSKAALAARDLPMGMTARDVASRLGSNVYDMHDDGHVLTCTFRFGDGSVLHCAFATRQDVEHYTATEMQTGITGTTLKRYQSGTIPGPFWSYPTYDFVEIPEYGPVTVEVDKTRTVTRWVLGNVQVLPTLAFGNRPRPSLLSEGPSVFSSLPPASGISAPTPLAPAQSNAPAPSTTGSSGEVEYWRGHVPQMGTAERQALMDAARKRLKTKSQFVVKALVVAGESAVADLKPDNGGARRLVTFSKRGGVWVGVSDRPGSSAAFEDATGITPDTEVTGEQ